MGRRRRVDRVGTGVERASPGRRGDVGGAGRRWHRGGVARGGGLGAGGERERGQRDVGHGQASMDFS